LTGKLGSFGQPVLRAKAKEMERQFAARLACRFRDTSNANGVTGRNVSAKLETTTRQ
jgi:hypothetical protein